MIEAQRPGAISLVVLCYMLCGPPIGLFVFVFYDAAVGWFGANPASNSSLGEFFLDLFAFPFAFVLVLPVAYFFAASPAIAAGLLSEGVHRISVRWGRNPYLCGLIGAATSAPLGAYFAAGTSSSSFAFFRVPPPVGLLWYGLWPAAGFIAAFCCNGVVQHFERRAELFSSVDSASEGSTS